MGHKAHAKGELDFPRGYHFEISSGFNQPGSGVSGDKRGYGIELKQQVRDAYGSYVGFALRGEMLPNDDTYMEIDENVKDKWGIPVSKFHFKWSDRELKQIEHGLKTAKQILENLGANVGKLPAAEKAISKGGEIIHEVGTTRMGSSAKDSVTNQWGQTWDCDNLFVMDAGVFASNPHKNCTLTIMTLAMRNSTWIAKQIEQGAL